MTMKSKLLFFNRECGTFEKNNYVNKLTFDFQFLKIFC